MSRNRGVIVYRFILALSLTAFPTFGETVHGDWGMVGREDQEAFDSAIQRSTQGPTSETRESVIAPTVRENKEQIQHHPAHKHLPPTTKTPKQAGEAHKARQPLSRSNGGEKARR